jgi:hypothetical protein
VVWRQIDYVAFDRETRRGHPLAAVHRCGRMSSEGPRGVGRSLTQCMTAAVPPGARILYASRNSRPGSSAWRMLKSIT